MRKISILFMALFATITLWASNVITYTASRKLPETTSTSFSPGLQVNAFNVAIIDHSFSNGQGTITFAGEVITIGNDAFSYCDSLKSITIPNSVTSIGDMAFSRCTSLKSVTIGNSVTSIKSYAFEGCKALESVTIPNSVTSIGSCAFLSCTSLSSITIPNGVNNIGWWAFVNCSSLTSITIPNSVTNIGDWAFYQCTSLSLIDVNAANTHYASEDGVLFNYAKDTLIQYPIGNTRTSYTIPNSVTNIGRSTFWCCTSLNSINIPDSVTSIGDHAFRDCKSLGSVTCYATTPPICGSGCFYDVNKSIPLYVLANSITTYQAADEWKDFTNILPISAEPATTTEVVVTPSDNSVTITWPTTDGADSYTIVINKGGAPFCTLTFNAQGQLTNIAFAPGRGSSNDAVMAEEVAGGYKFTITSLTPDTKYTYEVDTKNAAGTSIANYIGTFTTTGSTGLEETSFPSGEER